MQANVLGKRVNGFGCRDTAQRARDPSAGLFVQGLYQRWNVRRLKRRPMHQNSAGEVSPATIFASRALQEFPLCGLTELFQSRGKFAVQG